MITIRQFVGALLEEVTKARAISDGASVLVANKYLQHPLLKGYPIPRMHIREIEMELQFAVASSLHGVSIFESDEVRQNLRHLLRQFVEELPHQPLFAAHFGNDEAHLTRWRRGLDSLDVRLDRELSRKDADRVTIALGIASTIENYLHESFNGQTRGLRALFGWLRDWQGESAESGLDARTFIRTQVEALIRSVDTSDEEARVLSDLLDLKVHVEAAELEKVNPSRLQRMKLTFTSSDRRWVVQEGPDGQKHTLTRN